ncbi:WbqC family protein [Sulfurimonas sp.]
MIISAHQPAYNPWLGFIHKILISDVFVVMDDVQFEKNSFINRNKILQNSNELMISIPVKTDNYKSKKLKDIETANGMWKTKHIKSIKQSYNKSPNFEKVFKDIEYIYNINSNYLTDYTNAYLDFIVKYLDIDTKIILASDLDIKNKKLDYVIELTKKLDGDIFVFGALGKDYADVDYLKQNAITPYFQEYNHPKYAQQSQNFHSYMGILDILFNENKNSIKNIILTDNITRDKLRKFNA